MFDYENDWWLINIYQLIFNQGYQPEKMKKIRLFIFLLQKHKCHYILDSLYKWIF